MEVLAPAKRDEVLGRGAFSVVYKATLDGKPCAVKYTDRRENSRRYARHEVQVLKALKSTKYSLKMLSHKISKKGYIAYELLDTSLHRLKRPSEQLIKKIAIQLLEAIKEMHSCGVVHCDLKPENIMFSGEDLKIIDFGNAMFADELMTTRQTINTLYYRPPEYIINAPLDYRVDYWAYGCIIMELLIGQVLFAPRRDNSVHLHANMIGQMILLFGSFDHEFIASGRSSHKYFDVNNGNTYLWRHLLGKPTSLYGILRKHYSKNTALEWATYLGPFFNKKVPIRALKN